MKLQRFLLGQDIAIGAALFVGASLVVLARTHCGLLIHSEAVQCTIARLWVMSACGLLDGWSSGWADSFITRLDGLHNTT